LTNHRKASSAPAGTLPFGLLVLAGSFLLFQIELLMARLLLPAFGSSASVWTTCLMFYQGALFAGYLYAARASRWIAQGGYRWAHVAVVAAPIALFPFRVEPADLPPVAAILLTLALSAGIPFFVLSTTSVVCQAWFMASGHARRSDPYFLYGLSNAGALAALLSYPFVIERTMTVPQQLTLWYAGYAVYALINVWCVRTLGRAPAASIGPAGSAVTEAATPSPACPASALPRWPQKLEWLLLSAGANALLMVVTAVVSTDAPLALIWILPLTLYLVTLIVCFAPNTPSERTIQWWNGAGVVLAGACFFALDRGVRPEISTIALQCMILFVACLVCHERLVRSKPREARDLGAFYLAISLGGWLGSVLVGLFVPLAFGWLASHAADYAVAGLLILSAFVCRDAPAWMPHLRGHPLRSAAAGAAAAGSLALIGYAVASTGTGTVDGSRTFYGIYHVVDDHGLRRLYHGNTVHGVESLDPARRTEPLAYYHSDSPIGRFLSRSRGSANAAIVGLGVGALAAYREPGQNWDYYEIDPEVERIARTHFSFLSREPSNVIVGDARLSLARVPDGRYDVLVMDTFSSDFVPLHLITREAVAMYVAKLRPGGLVFFHISNRLFDLDPILSRIGASLGLRLAIAHGDVAPEVSAATGRFPSIWYAMTTDERRHAELVDDLGWSDRTRAPAADTAAAGNREAVPWTDDFVDLFEAMK
jgi:hypothetical protein